MSKLICDICGTSYSDTEHSCPTCGYARAFQEASSDAERVPVVREKVRGGRFSKRNVAKRLKQQARNPGRAESAAPATDGSMELAEEMRATEQESLVHEETERTVMPAEETQVLNIEIPEEVIEDAQPAEELPVEEEPVVEEAEIPEELPVEEEPAVEAVEIPEELPVEEEPAVEEAEIPEELPVEEEPAVEEAEIPEELPVEEEPAAEAVEIPEELPVEEEPVVEAVEIPEELPVEEETEVAAAVIPVEIAEEESVAVSDEEVPEEIPAAEPEQEAQDAPEPAEEKEEKKKKGGLLLNLVLGVSVTVFVLSALYLLINYAIPYIRNMEWPTQAVVETTLPTEEPTEALTDAPTDAPTEAPTDPPTEPPTEAPTDPPTEAPTEAPTNPLLDVKLELNYYDLTFGAATQTTALKANIIPNEDITWISDDPGIVTISETGVITAVGPGKTTVHAIYGDQEVTVKINCRF